jgi:hypothetical protein
VKTANNNSSERREKKRKYLLQVSQIVADLELQAHFGEWQQAAGPIMTFGKSQNFSIVIRTGENGGYKLKSS